MIFQQQEQGQIRWHGITPRATYKQDEFEMEAPLLRYYGPSTNATNPTNPAIYHIQATTGQFWQQPALAIFQQATISTLDAHQAQATLVHLFPRQHCLQAEQSVTLQSPHGKVQATALVWEMEQDRMYFYGPIYGHWQSESQ